MELFQKVGNRSKQALWCTPNSKAVGHLNVNGLFEREGHRIHKQPQKTRDPFLRNVQVRGADRISKPQMQTRFVSARFLKLWLRKA